MRIKRVKILVATGRKSMIFLISRLYGTGNDGGKEG